ncbi:MAG: putative sulfate exporter family transporter [Candidatus Delongbacteria bacterium]|nr:putative sulfate exporter family transporter [Candidatus Delongbacteria bacterium]MBN2834937.1 putative sulfate exporter family transporter [Candidatus Delongbacteria bacterium]
MVNIIMLIICLIPIVSPVVSLVVGIVFGITGLRYDKMKKYTSSALQISIVLMGFGMNLSQVVSAFKSGVVETAISVASVMTIGIILGKILKVEKNISILISAGTAICGGSAIAAITPILKSKNYQNSFALIVVFVLNAIALLLFPQIGHYLNLSQNVFGNWVAIAIHDTSSVVGAGAIYGNEALQIATTVKLIRALWIIPLSLIIAYFVKSSEKKLKFPWFILYFALAIIISNLISFPTNIYLTLSWFGRRGMVVALFLIGSSITINEIKNSGAKSFLHGIILWILTSIVSLMILI